MRINYHYKDQVPFLSLSAFSERFFLNCILIAAGLSNYRILLNTQSYAMKEAPRSKNVGNH